MPYLPTLAPFRIRSFRFQWPADLLTSWAFEMETLDSRLDTSWSRPAR